MPLSQIRILKQTVIDRLSVIVGQGAVTAPLKVKMIPIYNVLMSRV